MKLQRLREIQTFEESAEASKLISGAIYEGLLDCLGKDAEIEPTKVAINDDNQIVGVNFKIRCPHQIGEGVMHRAGYQLEITKPGSNLRILRPISESWVDEGEFVTQEFALDVAL